MRTFPLTDTPSTWGAWDTRPRLSDMGTPEQFDREAEAEYYREEFAKAMAGCDVDKPARFAGWIRDHSDSDPNAKRMRSVGEVLMDVVSERDFYLRTAQVLMLAAAGFDCQAIAKNLLEEAGSVWADTEVKS